MAIQHVDLERERNPELAPAGARPRRARSDVVPAPSRRSSGSRSRSGWSGSRGRFGSRCRGCMISRGYVGPVGAIVAVTLVAYIPALFMAFMAMSLLLDRQPALRVSQSNTGVTIVIAARNEEAGIAETIRSAVQTDYAGPVTFMLADNGSTDATCRVADTRRRRARRRARDRARTEAGEGERAEPRAPHGRDAVCRDASTPTRCSTPRRCGASSRGSRARRPTPLPSRAR